MSAQTMPSERQERLRVIGGDPVMDKAAAQQAVYDLLLALGQDSESAHLLDTPRRVADTYVELLSPQPFDLTTFPNDDEYDELILARGIAFASLCEHHLLPFHGVAHVGYVPGERILGLSKLARVVDLFSHQLQIQERLSMQVADWLENHLRPKAVGVVMEADHMCMSLRGAHAAGSRTVTSALRGLFRHDPRSRQEFFMLTGCAR